MTGRKRLVKAGIDGFRLSLLLIGREEPRHGGFLK